MADITQKEWSPTLITLEVGARGLVGSRTFRSLQSLGLTSRQANALCKSVSEIVARCSYAIYLAHATKEWHHNNDLVLSNKTEESKKSVVSKKPIETEVGRPKKITVLRKNGIQKLYHFTDAANIPSIRKNGLMSASQLNERKIEAKLNSDEASRKMDAEAGLEDYVRLSLCDNNPDVCRAQRKEGL